MMELSRREEILNICQVLSEQENLTVTVKEAAKGFCIAGAGASIGALVAGPLGIFVGGTIASAVAAYTTRGKFKSVVEIINNDMTLEQKNRLVEHVERAMQTISASDLQTLAMILVSPTMKEVIIKEIILYLSRELNLAVCR